jgi:hypothetical protein
MRTDEPRPPRRPVPAPSRSAPPPEFPEAVLDALIPRLPLREALRFAAVSKGTKQRTAQLWRPAWKSALQQATSSPAAESMLPQLAALAGDREDVAIQEQATAALCGPLRNDGGRTFATLASDAQMRQAIHKALAALEASKNKSESMRKILKLGPRLELEARAVYNALRVAAPACPAAAGDVLSAIGRRCSDAEYGTAFIEILRSNLFSRNCFWSIMAVMPHAKRLPVDYVLPALRLVFPENRYFDKPKNDYLEHQRVAVFVALAPKLAPQHALDYLMKARLLLERHGLCRGTALTDVVSSLPQQLVDSTLRCRKKIGKSDKDNSILYYFVGGASSACLQHFSDARLKQLVDLFPQMSSSIAERLPGSRVDRLCMQALRHLSFPLGRHASRRTSLRLLLQLSPHAGPEVQQQVLTCAKKLMKSNSPKVKAKTERRAAVEIMSNLLPLHPPDQCGEIVNFLVQTVQRWDDGYSDSMLDVLCAVQLVKAALPSLSPDQAREVWDAAVDPALQAMAAYRIVYWMKDSFFSDLGSRLGSHHSACWVGVLKLADVRQLEVHHLGVGLLSCLAISGSSTQMLTAWQAACTARTEVGRVSSTASDEALERLLPQLSQATIRAALANAPKEINTHYGRKAWEMLMDRADAATAHAGLTQLK